ncbi:hypothetical protein Ade02nite_23610 [Paractinoplanes deccanensis]|uniref:Uncharacterized protein n=1 Tax=Paractinoplanes deccanensis TaxID=113561 RepID=A0ABQ3Y158_9ACTN|nr:hypothetical protein Ade02nite_23610 [Actinoplanes deccanensis]
MAQKTVRKSTLDAIDNAFDEGAARFVTGRQPPGQPGHRLHSDDRRETRAIAFSGPASAAKAIPLRPPTPRRLTTVSTVAAVTSLRRGPDLSSIAFVGAAAGIGARTDPPARDTRSAGPRWRAGRRAFSPVTAAASGPSPTTHQFTTDTGGPRRTGELGRCWRP